MSSSKSPEIWRSDRFSDALKSMLGKELAIVADFDRTVTRGRSVECHNLLARSEVLSREWSDDAKVLDASSFLPHDERPPHLIGVEWWKSYNKIIKKHSITHECVKSAVIAHPDPLLRPGFSDFHETCHNTGTPLVVVSAGISNVVRSTFEKENYKHLPVPHIVSNTIMECGNIHPERDPITSSTKQHSLQHAPDHVKDILVKKPACLVIGDKPNDALVAEMHPIHSELTQLKVGIMNDEIRFEGMKETFDLIVDGHSAEAFSYIHETILSPLVGK
eukprot:TRINITY_DN11129_c0_g1_i2.p1 TRINITY_DN11129_c0_g1~~TRINITY_DN11129_c0_g1_i2.p1  ORF type:complete len:276 (+),score=24.99 TRINITY_DN11129_c0_g1_i2:114-941(+)